jgi:DegV family protein with EDD domain
MSAFAETAVVTDSTAYLPDEVCAREGIERVSVYVTLDGVEQREAEVSGDEYDRFYERLLRSAGGATTSQPSVGDFCAVYKPLLAAGREVVSLHLSSGISGTFNAARQAAKQLADEGCGGERIEVWDSRTVCAGLGMMALAAARAAQRGATATEAVAAADRARARLGIWCVVDTLDYLHKGGRIGPAQAWLGSALQIKPIITLGEEIIPVERVRTRRRAFDRMVEFGRELKRDGADGWVVQHIHSPERAHDLTDACRQIFGCEPLFLSEVGPAIGSHSGPGLLGVGGIPRALLEAN